MAAAYYEDHIHYNSIENYSDSEPGMVKTADNDTEILAAISIAIQEVYEAINGKR